MNAALEKYVPECGRFSTKEFDAYIDCYKRGTRSGCVYQFSRKGREFANKVDLDHRVLFGRVRMGGMTRMLRLHHP
jgi:hypothetical protein